MIKLIPLLLLVGCSSTQEMQSAYKAQQAIVEAQMIASSPVIRIECGVEEDSCKGLKFAYNPRSDIQVPSVTNTNDVAKEMIQPIADVLTTGSIVFGATRVLKTVSENSGHGNTNVRSTSVISGDENTASPEAGVFDSSVPGTVDNTHQPSVVNPVIVE